MHNTPQHENSFAILTKCCRIAPIIVSSGFQTWQHALNYSRQNGFPKTHLLVLEKNEEVENEEVVTHFFTFHINTLFCHLFSLSCLLTYLLSSFSEDMASCHIHGSSFLLPASSECTKINARGRGSHCGSMSGVTEPLAPRYSGFHCNCRVAFEIYESKIGLPMRKHLAGRAHYNLNAYECPYHRLRPAVCVQRPSPGVHSNSLRLPHVSISTFPKVCSPSYASVSWCLKPSFL